MKVLTLGMGAFGFAINKLMGEKNLHPNSRGIIDRFYGFELNSDIVSYLKNTRKHPYFFEGYKLPENIEIINDYERIIGNIDLLILAIPAQYISHMTIGLKNKLKPGVIILNLAKGIDITTNSTISSVLDMHLGNFDYEYAVLSGGMIASEVVEGKLVAADLGIKDKIIGEKIKLILENDNFKVKIRKNIQNIELYGSLKNIAAILVGYYEGKGYGASTIGYKLSDYYKEIQKIAEIYLGKTKVKFSYYSLGGDLIATCFGKSRNRYFGRLLGKGNNIKEVIEILEKEKRYAEGYETLKAVYDRVKDKKGFKNTKFLYDLIKG